jgi:hypothetical protein
MLLVHPAGADSVDPVPDVGDPVADLRVRARARIAARMSETERGRPCPRLSAPALPAVYRCGESRAGKSGVREPEAAGSCASQSGTPLTLGRQTDVWLQGERKTHPILLNIPGLIVRVHARECVVLPKMAIGA